MDGICAGEQTFIRYQTGAIVGIVAFGDPVTFWRIFFLVAIVAIVVGLKMISEPTVEAETSP